MPGSAKYQGEVVGKESIHSAFRAKYALAQREISNINSQDWDDMRLLLEAIIDASQPQQDIIVDPIAVLQQGTDPSH